MTQDIPRIHAFSNPRKPDETDSKNQLDPDKFKKILKVEESDESKQQDRRQRTKQEEEEEIEESKETQSNAPSDPKAFGAMMAPPTDTTSIFDTKEGLRPDYSLSPATTQANNDPISVYSSSRNSELTEANTTETFNGLIFVTPEDAENISLSDDTSDSIQPTPQGKCTTVPTEVKPQVPLPNKVQASEADAKIPSSEKKQPKKTSSILNLENQSKQIPSKPKIKTESKETPSKPKIENKPTETSTTLKTEVEPNKAPSQHQIETPTANIAPKKQKELSSSEEPTKPREQHEAETKIKLSLEALKKGEKETEEKQIVPSSSPPPKQIQSAKKTENNSEISEDKEGASASLAASISTQKTEQTLHDQKDRKEKEEQQKLVTSEGALPPPLPGHLWSITNAQNPAYATLQSDLFELFEKMIGVMTIEQSKGVSKTTIILNMPGSVFN